MQAFDIQEFKRERRAALLSLDLTQVRAYLIKYGETPPDDDAVLLASIHKARTGLRDLPWEARLESHAWLTARGLGSWDDGTLEEGRGA